FTYLSNKYDIPGATNESLLEQMRQVLTEIENLRAGRPFFVGDSLTLVDVVVAGSLGCVAPLPNGRNRVGPNTAPFFFQNKMALEFPALLKWRDGLYADFRKAPF